MQELDEHEFITALLRDVQKRHGDVFNERALALTLRKVKSRLRYEGIGFLTKTLPRLGKAFDKALTESSPLNAVELGFKPLPGSKLPMFMGELFRCVLDHDGTVLQFPCQKCVRELRQLLYLFYKYELPYSHDEEQRTIQSFKEAEDSLSYAKGDWELRSLGLEACFKTRRTRREASNQSFNQVAREARILLHKVFASFDPHDITPSHGPGAVSTKEQLWRKYEWTNIARELTDVYPLDAYFYASLGHVCDAYRDFSRVGDLSLPARVCLVPKDSRGPRLISCEPVDKQWIQQGLSRAIVDLVESHPLTKWNVFFTDQQPNQFGALLGSQTGRYATLDLKEASDRVHLRLVQLLFPEHLYRCLVAARSYGTVLPNGETLTLNKFAPMGSALCFPIMALSIWAVLSAAAPDEDTRESILVYGDDVIVPTAYAVDAMKWLESFGFLVNRDKSCTSGFFRESCGVDAFKGANVTPVRLRTVWSSSPCPEVYTSWLAYARSFWDRQYYGVYNYIVELILSVYRKVPTDDMNLSCPSLPFVPDQPRFRYRTNHSLQKREWRVRVVESPVIRHEINGWSMLLRYFTEAARPKPFEHGDPGGSIVTPFSVRSYTSRRTSMLVWRWQ